MLMNDYDKARAEAKRIYSKIGSVYCPLLDDYVHFTEEGFNYLIRKGHILRPRIEQLRRFALIPYLFEIVSYPKADIHLDDSRGMRFWNILKTVNGQRIRVVIMESGKKKIFLSVYTPS